MSIQRVFRGPLRSNFVLGALLAPAVACSGSNQASSNMVGNGSPSDSGGGADAASTPVILPVEQPEASSTPEAAGPAACVAPDLACDAGCLTNDTLNCGACGNACPAADGGAATCTASNGIYACGVSCDSGFASCGGACVPAATFQTDANNCGSCGHGCIGGTCIGGACQPWLVASNVFVASDNYANNQPPPFATDGVKVAYVMSGGQDGFSDVEVPLAGGTPVPVGGDNPQPTSVVAISGSYAVFGSFNQGSSQSTEDSVLVPVIGAGTEQWIDTGSTDAPIAAVISEDHTTIYAQIGWGDQMNTGSGSGGYVACPFQSGASCSSIFVPPNQTGLDTTNGLAINASYLFIGDVTNSKIWQYDLQSHTEFPLITDAELAPYLAIDPTYVYWADSASGTITVKRALQGVASTPETLVTLSGRATGLAVGGSTVYVGGETGSGSTTGGFVAYFALSGSADDAGAASDPGDAGAAVATAVTVYQGNPVRAIAAGGGAVLWLDDIADNVYAVRAP